MYKIFVDSCFFAVSIFFSNYSIARFILIIRFFIFLHYNQGISSDS